MSVITTGRAAVDERGVTGLNAAHLDALAQAVVQVQGAFVAVETQLVDAFSQTFDGVTTEVVESSEFRRTILERASGLVLGYETVSTVESADVVSVTLRTEVCADPRVAVRWTGPRDAESAFLGALRSALASSGWQVVIEPPGTSSSPLLSSLQTGASHVLRVQVRSQDRGTYRDLRQVEVGFSLSAQSVVSDAILAAFDTTFNVVGRTREEAEAEAARSAAAAMANELLRAIAPSAASTSHDTHPRLVFTGARRPNTSLELLRAVRSAAGVWSADVATGPADEVHIAVGTSRDLCALAADVASDRRLLLHVQSCSEHEVRFQVLRE